MLHMLTVAVSLALTAHLPWPSSPQATSLPSAPRNSGEWPQTATLDGVRYTLNQPQFTGIASGSVTMTAALQVKRGDAPESTGTVTMTASMATADVAGMVELNGFAITKVDGVPDVAGVSSALARSLQGMAITLPLSTLTQDITVTAVRSEASLSRDVPHIIVSPSPAVLISVTGEPALAAIGGSGWSKVGNTPFILLQAPDRSWWVRLGSDRWMRSQELKGPFSASDPPPQEVRDGLGKAPSPPEVAASSAAPAEGKPSTPPAVVVATRPTVLVSMDGQPKLAPVGPGTSMVTNTPQTVLVRTGSPSLWILASGRWFSSDAWTGPWTMVPPSGVPADFRSLDTSRPGLASAMASVPGTPAAREATAAAGLVRTVVLQRSKATCDVKWSGDPAFAPVQGTPMTFATNSSQPVIGVDGAFYCCDSAAWFKATSPQGPWTLCDAVPEVIASIPPSCPDYPVTFVQVYASDADTVTFGFTSGYVGTYIQDGAVVFGTGYDGGPGPQTWGAQAAYDQDTGTFTPPSGDMWGAWQPAVYPEVLAGGWAGWGWYPGWSTAYAWGWGHWGWNGGWDRWWNNWHPYDSNRWNDAWNDRSRADQLRNAAMNRAVNDRGFDARALSTAGGWNAIQRGIDQRATNDRMWNMARAQGDFNDPRAAMRAANGSAQWVSDGHRPAPDEGRRPVQRSPSGFHTANHPAARGGGRR